MIECDPFDRLLKLTIELIRYVNTVPNVFNHIKYIISSIDYTVQL